VYTGFGSVIWQLQKRRRKGRKFSRRFDFRVKLKFQNLRLVVFALVVYANAACTPLTSMWSSSQEKHSSQEKSVPQAVPAERPLVSNAFAYARYIAINLNDAPRKGEWTEDEIKAVLKKSSQQSGIPENEALKIYSLQTSSSAVGRTNQRIEKFREQVKTCASGSQGWSRESCCRALAGPAALVPEAFEAQASAPAEPEGRFRVQGMKAWLSVCHAVITGQPASLAEFRKFNPYQPASAAGWTQTLHAKSRAKRGPRRIYRSPDANISVAETLKPEDCSVLETEIIVRRPDGSLNFWVYDSQGQPTDISHFPPPEEPVAGGPKTVEKPSPDSCMGCHYDLKTREFNVQFASAKELNLASTLSLPVLCRQSGETLAEDN
jgi:hypothetical protein